MFKLTFFSLAMLTGCTSVVVTHDLETVKKDVAAVVDQEKKREPFESRLRAFGFDIQSPPDHSDCEAQLCLDDHCHHIFVVTYKVRSSGEIFDVKSTDVIFKVERSF